MKKVVILGATGSIGSSSLSIIRQFPEQFCLWGISAHTNSEGLAAIAAEFNPPFVVLANESRVSVFRERIPSYQGEVLVGEAGLCALASSGDADIVIAGIVGVAGLRPVEAALRAGRRVLLANKESLVCAGEQLTSIAKSFGGTLLPIDSEHSAIFQLLEGRSDDDLSSITLTASGGPFWQKDRAFLAAVTPEQAVKHPRWSMGAKISIDSATLVNKALELIEAAWLFNLSEDRIGIVIHPESIIHSLVSFQDGTQFAHLSVPDMCGPIGYAMAYPGDRLRGVMKPLRLEEVGALTFAPIDTERFPAPALARDCLRSGGNASAVFNIVNEGAVALFTRGLLRFVDIVPLIERGVARFFGAAAPSVDEIIDLTGRLLAWVEEEGARHSGGALS